MHSDFREEITLRVYKDGARRRVSFIVPTVLKLVFCYPLEKYMS